MWHYGRGLLWRWGAELGVAMGRKCEQATLLCLIHFVSRILWACAGRGELLVPEKQLGVGHSIVLFILLWMAKSTPSPSDVCVWGGI